MSATQLSAGTPSLAASPENPDAGKSSRLAWLIAMPLAAILLYFSFRGVEWRRVWTIVCGCRIPFLLAALCIGTLSYVVRAWRWRVLLNAQEKQLGFATVLWASSAGYLGNNFLPARAGELVRTGMISARSHISKSYVFTTAMTERVVDAIVIVLIGSFVALGLGQKPAWLERVSAVAAAATILGALCLAILPKINGLAHGAIGRVPLSPALQARLRRIADNVTAAMHGFRNPSRFVRFLLLTGAIWLLDANAAMMVARALQMHLSLAVALLLSTGMAVGSALPSTPGAVGIVQFVAVTVLTPFHFTRTDAIAYILVAQAAGYVVITSLGLLGVWRYRAGSR